MAAPKPSVIKLNLEPTIVSWPETHYVFLERIGPFQNTAEQAWQELHKLIPAISEHNQVTGYLSLYKMGPNIYRAGVALAAEPNHLPENVKYEKFLGGKYSRFVLTGPYSGLPEASGRVYETVSRRKIELRDDFSIENYINDPRTTSEDQLVTEILVPTA
jgi:effector-binding domain-containing protein